MKTPTSFGSRRMRFMIFSGVLGYVSQTSILGQSSNTLWLKIGTWNMSLTKWLNPSLNGVQPADILSASVTVMTDADANGKVEVDYLDRSSGAESFYIPVTSANYMGRGGICSVKSPASTLFLDVGEHNTGAGNRNRFTLGLHSGTGNRGWIRLDYKGTAVNASQPYAIKTKVFDIGEFLVNYCPPGTICPSIDLGDPSISKDVNLSSFGYPMNRVTSFRTTMLADDRIMFTDIYRLGSLKHPGGVSVLTDRTPNPTAVIRILPDMGNYFRTGNFSFNSANRGFIKIDYLAAECADGSGPFTKSTIGAFTPDDNDCHGMYTPPQGGPTIHVIQTQAPDIWGTADKVTFVNQPQTVSDFTIEARVDKIENTNPWARAGVMIRASRDAYSRHVAMVVTPGNGIGFTVRSSDGGTTTEQSPNNYSAPYWVRVVKLGNTFTGYMSPNGSAWTQVGNPVSINFPANGGTYYAGLCQTAGNNSPSLYNTSVYSNVSLTPNSPQPSPPPPITSGTYYKIINKNSGKALDVYGASMSDGGNIVQWGYNGGNNQIWQLIDVGGGYWRIVNKNSGKVVDVSGNSTSDGANVHQWGYVGANNQQWQITDVGNGYYKIIARHSGKALDVNGGSTSDGGNVIQWTYGGGNNQQWQFQAP